MPRALVIVDRGVVLPPLEPPPVLDCNDCTSCPPTIVASVSGFRARRGDFGDFSFDGTMQMGFGGPCTWATSSGGFYSGSCLSIPDDGSGPFQEDCNTVLGNSGLSCLPMGHSGNGTGQDVFKLFITVNPGGPPVTGSYCYKNFVGPCPTGMFMEHEFPGFGCGPHTGFPDHSPGIVTF